MRMRFKPYARPELAAWPNFVGKPATHRGNWNKLFSDAAKPLRLELGCGKGGFMAALAPAQPNFNYIGVDIKSEVLVVAKRTIEKAFADAHRPINNLVLTAQNIELMETILAPEDQIGRIYINFCNPWYKAGHAKHRLTHPRQLIQYREFLRENGEIYFKTDDARLFEDSLRYFAIAGFEVAWCTRNLHLEEPGWNIRTEHEKMFSEEGVPIKACIAVKRPAVLNKEEISVMRDV